MERSRASFYTETLLCHQAHQKKLGPSPGNNGNTIEIEHFFLSTKDQIKINISVGRGIVRQNAKFFDGQGFFFDGRELSGDFSMF